MSSQKSFINYLLEKLQEKFNATDKRKRRRLKSDFDIEEQLEL